MDSFSSSRPQVQRGGRQPGWHHHLLQTVLHGEPALERWETLGQYAEAAGVTRKSLEKEAKVAALKEKLKFWKYLKKIK